MEAQPIPEVDVLIAVAKWLHRNDWQLEKVSLASGQGIDQANHKEKVRAEFTAAGIDVKSISFVSKGEDIRARHGTEVWRIECKGLGNVSLPTLKTNFDRAVASAVSYYNQRAGLRLGLAVTEEYGRLIRDKLPQVLREAINLWIFLYVSADNEIYVFRPDEESPYSSS